MRYREENAASPPEQGSTVPIDFGEETTIVARETHVAGDTIVSDEAGNERQIAEVVPPGQSGLAAAYHRARGEFERDFAADGPAIPAQWDRERTFTQAEPNYRAGFVAGHDLHFEDQEFEAIEAGLRREYEASTATSAEHNERAFDRSWERQRAEIRRDFQKARQRA